MLNTELSRINNAFRGTNIQPEHPQDPNSVDTFVEFEWATTDPDGQPLARPGVHVVTTDRSSYSENIITSVSENNPCWTHFWDPNKYLNVWVLSVPNAGWGGLGTYPALHDNPVYERPKYLYGSWVNTSAALEVLLHEFGHNLGLRHVFKGGGLSTDHISLTESCSSDADGCNDTPNYHRDRYIYERLRTSCEGNTFHSTNHMDYGDGAMNSFTYDQRKIIRTTVEKGIWIPIPRNRGARFATGTDAPLNLQPPRIEPCERNGTKVFGLEVLPGCWTRTISLSRESRTNPEKFD